MSVTTLSMCAGVCTLYTDTDNVVVVVVATQQKHHTNPHQQNNTIE